MKKRIGSNYGILVIILFAVVCFLTDYIVIERKINEGKDIYNSVKVIEKSTDCVDSVCNCDFLSYKDVAGLYSADFNYEMKYDDGSIEVGTTSYNLYLYTDGSFYYHFPGHIDHGYLGNYTFDGNNLYLNVLFKHGSDIGRSLNFLSKNLKFDGSKNLIDVEPFSKPIDSTDGSVTLVKKNSFTDYDNENSMVKELYKNGILYNGN